MKTIEVKVKVMEGKGCIVKNYRRKPAEWENGTVRHVAAHIRPDGTYGVTYSVLLDRRTTGRSRMFPDGGAPIFLHVGDEAIEPHNEYSRKAKS